MTKIYEKLTADWKAGKLPLGYFYVKYKNREIGIQDNFIDNFLGQLINPIIQVIAPVPTYDEYKAMQAELAEFKRTITSYVGKPIDYDIACETVNKLLDDKEQLKKALESSCWYQTVQNEDIGKLRGLLKGCKLSTFKIYNRLRFSDENEITPADLINAVDEIKPMLWGILNSINAALGESEE